MGVVATARTPMGTRTHSASRVADLTSPSAPSPPPTKTVVVGCPAAAKRKRGRAGTARAFSSSGVEWRETEVAEAGTATHIEGPREETALIESEGFDTWDPVLELAQLDGLVRVAMNNPEITAVLALASLFVVPRAIEQIEKIVVLPLMLIAIMYLVATNPSSIVGAATTVLGFLWGHPKLVAGAALGLLALRLSPYLLVALVLLFMFNVGNVVIDESVNPFLPKEVKESMKEVWRDAGIA